MQAITIERAFIRRVISVAVASGILLVGLALASPSADATSMVPSNHQAPGSVDTDQEPGERLSSILLMTVDSLSYAQIQFIEANVAMPGFGSEPNGDDESGADDYGLALPWSDDPEAPAY